MRKTIASALTLSAAVLIALALLWTQLSLERQWRAKHERRIEDLVLPTSTTMSALSLNYRTLGATVAWLALVAQHAEYVQWVGTASDRILTNGITIARLDARFHRLFDWVPGAFLNRRFPISVTDLDRTADFYELGFPAHPDDADLRFSAGLLFVGYGRGFSDEEYAAMSARAVGYLEEAARLAPRDEQILATLRFFRHRYAKYSGAPSASDADEEAAFWMAMLKSSADPAVRARATKELTRLGRGKLLRDEVQTLLDEHAVSAGFMPLELWLLTRPEEGA